MLFSPPKTPPTQHYTAYAGSMPRQDGKTIAITGTTSGTGQVLARTVGDLGARVLLVNRLSKRADAAYDDLVARGADAVKVDCDLQDLASVRMGAERIRELCPDGLDVLVNNAGVMGLNDEATGDGFDVQMQTNHLSHFLLTHLVWDRLEQAATERGEARIVQHSSGARLGIELDAAYLGRNGGSLGGDGFPGLGRWRRYQQTKLANLLFAYALMDAIAEHRPAYAATVKSLCAHPGPTDSGLQGKTAKAGGTRLLDRYILWDTLRRAHSTEDGTMGILRAACAPDVQTGDFFGPLPKKAGPAEKLPPERDAAGERMLWEESLRALDIASFFP